MSLSLSVVETRKPTKHVAKTEARTRRHVVCTSVQTPAKGGRAGDWRPGARVLAGVGQVTVAKSGR